MLTPLAADVARARHDEIAAQVKRHPRPRALRLRLPRRGGRGAPATAPPLGPAVSR